MKVETRPCPFHSSRPSGTVIDTIVLHADASGTEQSTIEWLNDRRAKVSYHYLVGRDGKAYQFVETSRRAWHAGVSSFLGRKHCNDYSIGVAFSNRNDGVEPYTADALDAAATLCAELMRRYPAITLERITTHYAVSPGRKDDPREPFTLSTFQSMVAERCVCR